MTQEMTIAAPAASTTALAVRLGEMREQMDLIQRFVREVMVQGVDYGTIPGTGDRKVLLKPGAEKLAELYGYALKSRLIERELDRDSGYYRVQFTIDVIRRSDGGFIGDGVGECTSWEGRYRWRNAARTCPSCGADAIIRGREEFGGGWLCWGKRGGCGLSFGAEDSVITDQPLGKVVNDDLAASWNTVLKMARKRAMVDAVISTTRTSGLFTQDLDDDHSDRSGDPKPQRQTATPQRQQRTTTPGGRVDWSAFWAAVAQAFGEHPPKTDLRQAVIQIIAGGELKDMAPADLARLPAVIAEAFAAVDWRTIRDLEDVPQDAIDHAIRLLLSGGEA